jgi:gliotoxin/aspirochlorine biosynthesis peptide synthetase
MKSDDDHASTLLTLLSDLSTALDRPPSQLNLDRSFVDNGGNSLTSIQLLALLRKRGAQIPITSLFAAGKLRDLVDQICPKLQQAVKNHSVIESATITRSRRRCSTVVEPNPKRQKSCRTPDQAPEGRGVNQCYPMTELQLAMIESTDSNPDRNIISYYETHRPEAVPALKQAWEKVLMLEPIFRMAFEIDQTGGYMVDLGEMPFVWREIVCADESSYEAEVENPLPLDGLVGFNFKAVTLSSNATDEKTTIIWRIHHSMIDGASHAIVRSKVQSVVAGERIAPGLSFAAFALGLQRLQSELHESGVDFWARHQEEHISPSTHLLLVSRGRLSERFAWSMTWTSA